MTVELAVVLPVVIVVAVIVVNAMTFFAECAEFDRVGRNAVRMCATSPSGSVELSQIAAEVESAVEESMALDADEVEVLARQVDSGHAAFELVLRFRPGLFGKSMALDADEVEVLARQVDSGHAAFELVLRFRPGLFGMGLRDEVFGVQLPALTHTVELTVDRYKPGMFV